MLSENWRRCELSTVVDCTDEGTNDSWAEEGGDSDGGDETAMDRT